MPNIVHSAGNLTVNIAYDAVGYTLTAGNPEAQKKLPNSVVRVNRADPHTNMQLAIQAVNNLPA